MSLLARIHGWRGVVTVRSGVSTWSRSFGLGSRRMASTTSGEEDSDDDFKPKVKKADGIIEEIGKIVKDSPVVLFMKGLPSAPQCGFSMKTVNILNSLGAEYRAFNVLSSEELRHGVKVFSKWPTIPQLYVKGEFVGGCDIVEGMLNDGSLKKLLESTKGEKKAKS